jgi:hypothetical protein
VRLRGQSAPSLRFQRSSGSYPVLGSGLRLSSNAWSGTGCRTPRDVASALADREPITREGTLMAEPRCFQVVSRTGVDDRRWHPA